MGDDIDIIKSSFRNSSSRISQLIFNDFRKNIRKLDRQKDENVFQQLLGRYIHELERKLADEAGKALAQYQVKVNINILRRELTSQVSYNMSEFLLKVRSM